MKKAILAGVAFVGISGLALVYFFSHGKPVNFDLNKDYIGVTSPQTSAICIQEQLNFGTQAQPLEQQVLAIQTEYNQYAFTTGQNNNLTINAMYNQYFATEDKITTLQQNIEKDC